MFLFIKAYIFKREKKSIVVKIAWLQKIPSNKALLQYLLLIITL